MSIEFSPGDLVKARFREWVVLPSPREGILALRPLTGSESDTILLDPKLELTPVRSATFKLPADAEKTTQTKAALLADALQLTLRRGAGPFRSAAQLNFEPRIYQLVPLLMALRLQIPRLLIADDVGVGKTIEAGLILREFLDRGEVEAFSVLCPPHLVDQWTNELSLRFGIETTAVTASSAVQLERKLPPSQSLFETYPHTVVSLDYIKAEKRRDTFARVCPDFVIVDEAHSCVGTNRGKQQRFELLTKLSSNSERSLILLTATPHSGNESAFARLLSLIDPEFESLDIRNPKFREHLARHFVQRRRIDLTANKEWGEERSFPTHETTELDYQQSTDFIKFQDAVLNYCLNAYHSAGEVKQKRRIAVWGTLALMRCVGSSPAAALSTLRNRQLNLDENLESHVFDDDSDDEDAIDIEPNRIVEDSSDLSKLIKTAEELQKKEDKKLLALIDVLKPQIKEGRNPVIFCRYLATADHIATGLKKHFAKKVVIEKVTGVLTPSERHTRVEAMFPDPDDEKDTKPRILVSTDCLSEGINLQQFFDTVIHYDLSWNPTRHQQREGRVDRYGQSKEVVRSILMYSRDTVIDGSILEVIYRKAEEIKKTTGVIVPLPEDRGPLTSALMDAILESREKSYERELELQFKDGSRDLELYWQNTSENEKRSRTIFAQNAIKPEQVIPEWKKSQSVLGKPEDVSKFVENVMSCLGTKVEIQNDIKVAHLSTLDSSLKERLELKEIKGKVRFTVNEPVPFGITLLNRTHPLPTTLAESLVEASLDPDSIKDLSIGRVGAWKTDAVERMTRIILLRLRHKLTTHMRREQLLLAEESALVALDDTQIVSTGESVKALLNVSADDIADPARDRFISQASEKLPDLLAGPLFKFAQTRKKQLSEDHNSLRGAIDHVSRSTIETITPPDVIGLFVLLPNGD